MCRSNECIKSHRTLRGASMPAPRAVIPFLSGRRKNCVNPLAFLRLAPIMWFNMLTYTRRWFSFVKVQGD